jgi:hypothetical protein
MNADQLPPHWLEKSFRIDPLDPITALKFTDIGGVLLVLGRIQGAVTTLDRAAQAAPSDIAPLPSA